MLRPKGYGQIVDPDRPVWESDTCQCGHCGKVVFVKPGTATTVYRVLVRGRWTEEPGAFCRCCMRPVCLACDDVGTCRPVEVLLESLEAVR
jgi:hypothetical protein